MNLSSAGSNFTIAVLTNLMLLACLMSFSSPQALRKA